MISRRRLLESLAAMGACTLGLDRALAQSRRRTLVVVFLRGGVDGLALAPPSGDPALSSLRPTIAVQEPLRLDATFSLHPALSKLVPLFQSGRLALVHAAGLPQSPRSHFDAQDFLESGTPGRRGLDGWLNRAGQGLSRPLEVVALQPTLPGSLRGETPALALDSLADFKLRGADATTFEALYDQAVDAALRSTGHEAFESLDTVTTDGLARRPAQNGADWKKDALSRRLRDIARLIHADVGLSLAATEVGGFDTHLAQGGATGQLATRLTALGDALSTFAQDLGPRLDEVTLVTMTEFGRTARENGGRGTDHGTASVSLVMGGGVRGGRVIADWPGLAPAALHEGRDVKMTTDLRAVMAECLGATGLDARRVFPDFVPRPLGLFG